MLSRTVVSILGTFLLYDLLQGMLCTHHYLSRDACSTVLLRLPLGISCNSIPCCILWATVQTLICKVPRSRMFLTVFCLLGRPCIVRWIWSCFYFLCTFFIYNLLLMMLLLLLSIITAAGITKSSAWMTAWSGRTWSFAFFYTASFVF